MGLSMSFTIHATAAFGLEAVVKKECEDLGFQNLRIEYGHVIFQGDKRDLVRANMSLRSADRVFIEVASFPVTTFEGLFEEIRKLPWKEFLPREASFPVTAKSISSKLFSLSDIQSISKKAIVTNLKEKYFLDHFPETGPIFPIEVNIRQDQALVLLDTSGEGLFKRGYREKKGMAPLKETLAHGLVDLSFWDPSRTLVDPFCGSATILIEAAMKARRIAPGLNRSFLSMSWDFIGEEVFKDVRRELLGQIDYATKLEIYGFDNNPRVLDHARNNALEAGVGEDIILVHEDMRKVYLDENFGVMITNPPYGDRMGEIQEAEALMHDFRDHFFHLRTWSFYIISSMKNLEEIFDRSADRRRKLFNGGLETTYYQFYGPNPNKFL